MLFGQLFASSMGQGFAWQPSSPTKALRFPPLLQFLRGASWGQCEASALRGVNERTVEITQKINGENIYAKHIEISSDVKTLTSTIHMPARSEPTIRVFERQ